MACFVILTRRAEFWHCLSQTGATKPRRMAIGDPKCGALVFDPGEAPRVLFGYSKD